jgi:hypothetical protein
LIISERGPRSVIFDEYGLTMLNGKAGGHRIGRGIQPANRVELPPPVVIPTVSHDVTSAETALSRRVEDYHHVAQQHSTQLSSSRSFVSHTAGHHCNCHIADVLQTGPSKIEENSATISGRISKVTTRDENEDESTTEEQRNSEDEKDDQ